MFASSPPSVGEPSSASLGGASIASPALDASSTMSTRASVDPRHCPRMQVVPAGQSLVVVQLRGPSSAGQPAVASASMSVAALIENDRDRDAWCDGCIAAIVSRCVQRHAARATRVNREVWARRPAPRGTPSRSLLHDHGAAIHVHSTREREASRRRRRHRDDDRTIERQIATNVQIWEHQLITTAVIAGPREHHGHRSAVRYGHHGRVIPRAVDCDGNRAGWNWRSRGRRGRMRPAAARETPDDRNQHPPSPCPVHSPHLTHAERPSSFRRSANRRRPWGPSRRCTRPFGDRHSCPRS